MRGRTTVMQPSDYQNPLQRVEGFAPIQRNFALWKAFVDSFILPNRKITERDNWSFYKSGTILGLV